MDGLLRSQTAPTQFARFVLAGGSANLAYAALFLLLADLGELTANLAGSVVSAALANELHRRLTFRAGGRVAWWTAQWQGGATLGAALAASSLALALLDALTAGGGPILPLLAAAAVNGVIGLVRFLVLRRLFGRRPSAVVLAFRVERPVPAAIAA